ncbi:unnamed protein product, partial [Meganyctiphanes norvegica]
MVKSLNNSNSGKFQDQILSILQKTKHLWNLIFTHQIYHNVSWYNICRKTKCNGNIVIEGETPLFMACAKGHLILVQALIKRRANREMANSKGLTPLHVACSKCKLPIIQELLAAGVKIDAQTNNDT